MSAPAKVPAGRSLHWRRSGFTLALLAFAQLIISIDYNIVYVALPHIGTSLGFSAHTLQWVISAYAVAFGGFLLLGGRACDLLGRRRMFITGLLLYAVSSLAGGVANDAVTLIIARAVQGLGGAFLFPATLALVNTSFGNGPARYRALSVWAAAGASGMVIGSLLGGVLTQAFGWHAVFLVNVVLAGVAALLAFGLIPPDQGTGGNRSFDIPGALSATGGATLLVLALVEGPVAGWNSAGVLASAIGGVVLLGIFALVESRSRDALMPLRIFGNRNLATGVVVASLFMATFGTLLYFITVYFQNVQGYSALRTGLAYLPPMVGGFAGSMLGGRLATRFGVRPTLIVSLAVGAVAVVLLAMSLSTHAGYLAVAPSFVLLSIPQGVIYTTVFAASATDVAPAEQGVAGAMVSTGQQIGYAMGLAVLVAVANVGVGHAQAGQALQLAVNSGLRHAVFACAAGIVLTLLVAINFTTPKPQAEDSSWPDDSDELISPSTNSG
jgi:EmrB/QacA subfamily drug resistance transporter